MNEKSPTEGADPLTLWLFDLFQTLNGRLDEERAEQLEERLAEYRRPNVHDPVVNDDFVPCKDADTFRREVLKMLRRWRILGLPLGDKLFEVVEDEELRWLWWPDTKARERRRMQEKRLVVDWSLADAEAKGIPRSKIWKDAAEYFGHNSGEAARKAFQPNRLNRRPRRKPRG